MVLRIDFGYIAEEREKITQEQARKDLERFLNNQRGNSLFKYMVGYIWKLEFGARKGLHFHFIIIFNGANVQKDVYVAWKVSEYWKIRLHRIVVRIGTVIWRRINISCMVKELELVQ